MGSPRCALQQRRAFLKSSPFHRSQNSCEPCPRQHSIKEGRQSYLPDRDELFMDDPPVQARRGKQAVAPPEGTLKCAFWQARGE